MTVIVSLHLGKGELFFQDLKLMVQLGDLPPRVKVDG
jgi:hypothetical protein